MLSIMQFKEGVDKVNTQLGANMLEMEKNICNTWHQNYSHRKIMLRIQIKRT